MNSSGIIKFLKLKALPVEGGFFSETYRSQTVSNRGKRSSGTCIYYLLDDSTRSYWHKLSSDEIWFYHCGSPAIQILLFPDGRWEERILGPNLRKKQILQSIIPAGTWQATVLKERKSWSLFSTVVCPGFDFKDYHPGKGSELIKNWPSAEKLIRKLRLI
ncbi:MAG: cupin domain-containing protein [Bacteroidales bacterium]|nr:cupin domain-containing protein [Bacteroidales bacterium]